MLSDRFSFAAIFTINNNTSGQNILIRWRRTEPLLEFGKLCLILLSYISFSYQNLNIHEWMIPWQVNSSYIICVHNIQPRKYWYGTSGFVTLNTFNVIVNFCPVQLNKFSSLLVWNYREVLQECFYFHLNHNTISNLCHCDLDCDYMYKLSKLSGSK